MLFSVGYATKSDDRLVQEIIALKEGINEVYFSWEKRLAAETTKPVAKG